MIHEAIYKLYPNVTSIDDKPDNSIVCWDENRNEVSIDTSAVDTKVTELQTEEDNKKAEQETLKASAKAKLIAGEALTEAEADTIVL